MVVNPFCFNLLLIVFIISIDLIYVKCEFENQPKIQNHDGTLILEPAWNKNVTLRLTHDSNLYFGDMNVMDEVRQLLLIKSKNGGEKSFSSGGISNLPSANDNLPAVESFPSIIRNLKLQLLYLDRRLNLAKNRTNGQMQQRRIRQFLGRLQTIERRVRELETNLQTDECKKDQKNPCLNGGTCFDGYKSFRCECAPEWTGNTCEEDVDECYILAGTDLGCQNGGYCINNLGGYRCACINGFSGTHCRIKNATCESAQSAEICGHGICLHANNEVGYTCLCDQGWEKDNATLTCTKDVDECASPTNPCHNGCVNTPGSFNCEPCPTGYSGNGITCKDINECALNNGGCSLQPKVQCINTEGSYRCGNCPPGYSGDGRNCVMLPSKTCSTENICHPRAKCEYISGTVVCTCPLGMFGHGFGPDGCSMEGNTTDPCANHICKNNGTCIISGRGTLCICQTGFLGALCEQPDACQSNPCQNGGTCKLLPGNHFSCTCERGSTGKKCEVIREVCGSTLRQESGELSYPAEGDHYEPFERCAWMIQTADTKVLNLTFTKFDLEEPETLKSECSKDWLQIHDGRSLTAPLIGRFCGKSLPLGGTVQSSHKQMLFWFRSNNTTHGGGFTMKWTSQAHTCGGVMELDEDETGIIRSPGYPGKMAPNRNCEWQLIAPFGYRLVLRIYEAILGSTSINNCTRDTLNIFDSDLLLKAICETSQPEPLHTSSNKAVIRLHTDGFSTDSAFQLHFEVIPGTPHCGGLFTEPEGIIVGYMNARICEYLIQQPTGMKIELDFLALDLLISEDCHVHKIEVFDGKTEDDNLLKRLCGNELLTEPLISSSNFLLLRYEFIIGIQYPKQFRAKYRRVCDEKFFGPEGGIITTPNYPKPYFDQITCTYDIYGPIGTVVHVNFTDFSMSETIPAPMGSNDGNETIIYDNFVEVFLSNKNKLVFYKGAPMHLVSEQNRLRIVFHSKANSRKERGLRIEYDFETLGCGGVLSQNESSFTKYGTLFNMPAYCEWIIEAPLNKHIFLDLKYERFGSKCHADEVNLFIYANNTNGDSQLLGSYCGNDDFIKESIHSSIVTIILKKPINAPHYVTFGLFVTYNLTDSSEDCGGTFNARFGVIKTPGWPRNYRPLSNCVWYIGAPSGHQIELVVQNFTLENSLCQDDYLEIRNGINEESPLIGKYCGTSIPRRIPSFTNHLYLHFKTDKYIEENGFYITWQQTRTGCGGKLNSHVGTIHTPTNVENGTVTCDWYITVAAGSIIELKLIELDDIFDVCASKQMLLVYDGPQSMSPLLHWNCNMSNVQMSSDDRFKIRSSKNQMFIRYQNPNADTIFMLEYKTLCQNIKIENSLLGVIESPNFPESYPPSMSCSWDIHSGRNNKISLIFSHLQLEQRSAACELDAVEVIDMQDDVVLKRKRFCMQPLEPYISEGNHLMLKFESDYSNNMRGFRMEYKRLGCGEHFHHNFGVFSTPMKPYSVGMDCDWFIEVAAGKQIILTFSELHIETDRSDCSEDALIVSETKNSMALLRECSVGRTDIKLTSPANRFYVHFHSSEKRMRKYFRASYIATEAKCGGIFRAPSGFISSPNFPEYATNVECVWKIAVFEATRIKIAFVEFNMTQTVNCTDASLDIRASDGGGMHENFCNSPKDSYSISTNSLTIKLVLSGNSRAKFVLRYEKFCGGVLTAPTGILRAESNQYCAWLIEPPEDALVSLDILHLDCPCGTNSTRCGLTIESGRNSTGNIRSSTCLHTFTNFLNENFVVTAAAINFRAKYSTLEKTCGGTITTLKGILSSPTYHDSYPEKIECVWEIIANKGNVIELNFISLDIVSSPHCNEDFLEIRTAETDGKLIGVYCGNQLPNEPLLINEKVWLKFKSAENSIGGKGFKLSWEYAHLVEFNVSSGTIEAPPTNAVHNEEEAFSWRIFAARGSLITFNLKAYSQGLKIYDGFDESALQLELQYSPWTFASSSNVFYITTVNSELEYFLITWKVDTLESVTANAKINTCHEMIVLPNNARVNISTPNYPNNYKRYSNCKWIIKTEDPTLHVVLNIYEIDLEETSKCTADFVRVSSSSDLAYWREISTQCEKLPFSYIPKSIIHGTPYLQIEFHSDQSIAGKGFTSLVFTACGSNMTAPVGTIIDRNLLRVRKLNSTCIWHINVRPGKRIEFLFDYGNREMYKKNEKCDQYALIYDGLDTSAPLLPPGQICNHPDRNVKLVQTSTNYAILKYNVSWNIFQTSFNMWNLTYREFSECDGEIVLTDLASWFNISSPRYPNVPQPHTECNWIVIAPPGETIRADFIGHFDLSFRYCQHEHIDFHDGSTTLARPLGRFCTQKGTVLSTGNIMHIRFLTDVSEPHSRFQLNVTIATCGGITHTLNGFISSIHYPALGAYAKGSVCEWTIVLKKNLRLKLNFTDIHLPYDAKHEAASDRIEIETLNENPVLLAVYFGNLTQMPLLEVDSNSVVIRLRSFALDNSKFRGFKLKYNGIYGNCYREFNNDVGQIYFNRLGHNNNLQQCRWRITVPRGQRVSFQITDLQWRSNNATPALMIYNPAVRTFPQFLTFTFYNDYDMNSKITEFNANEFNNSIIINSTDNIMMVRFQVVGATFTVDKIEASYNSDTDSACPLDIPAETSTGLINFPESLLEHGNFYCHMFFQLSGLETIMFKIDDLVVEKRRFSNQYAMRIRNEDLFVPFSILKDSIKDRWFSLSPKRGSINWIQNENIRIKKFSAKYFRNSCGGTYPLTDGLIVNFPNINLPVNNPLECVWTLRSGVNPLPYQLVGNTSFLDSCDNEYISIYSGVNADGAQIAKLCRDNQYLNSSELQRGYTQIVYHTELYEPRQSNFLFRIEKSIKCGSKIMAHLYTKPITIDAKAYKNNFECFWEFEANPGLLLSIKFKGRFFIEESVNCTKDYIEVSKIEHGLWFPITRFCGREVPTIYNTNTGRIMMKFHTDNAITGDGFSFNVLSHCDAVLNVTEQTQILHLPNIYKLSQSSVKCNMTFQTVTDKMMHIRIRSSLEESYGRIKSRNKCEYSSFIITRNNNDDESEESVETEEYCWDTELRAKKFIRIVYNGANNNLDYFIEYDLNLCGGNITSPRTIQSAQQEKNDFYIETMNCVWYVQAPKDHSIVIRFKYFEMEEQTKCDWDYFAAYKGTTLSDDKRVTKICGNLTENPPTIVIDSNQAVIVAISDNSVSLHGFLADIVFVPNCNERITLSDGNSPVALTRQFKFNATEQLLCYYRIIAPEGYRVSIQLRELALNNATCLLGLCETCNHIELYDSIGTGHASMGKYCTNGRADVKRLSSYEDALLKLSGIQAGEYSFEIVLQMEPTTCGAQTLFKLQGNQVVTIAFPNGNQTTYPPNTHCTWRIETEDELILRFDSFLLQNASQITGECIDYVHVKGESTAQRFCGNATGFEMSIGTNRNTYAELTFHSDETIEESGFIAKAQHRFACNRTYTSISGEIQYNGYGDLTYECIDEIRVPENYVITVILQSSFFNEIECKLGVHHLKIIDVHTNKTLLQQCTHSFDIKKIYTTTNALRIAVTSYSFIRMNYFVNDKNAPLGCGGRIQNFEGTFSSPPYNDRNSSECRWEIEVPPPNQIKLAFFSFDMGSDTNCHLNYVQVFKLQPNGVQKLSKTLCGQNLELTYFDLKSNRIAIVAKKSPNFDGTGFTVSFSMVEIYNSWPSTKFLTTFP